MRCEKCGRWFALEEELKGIKIFGGKLKLVQFGGTESHD
jgi:hypothetical protein